MTSRTLVCGLALACPLLFLTGCSDRDSTRPSLASAETSTRSSTPSAGLAYSPHSVGFGEALNTEGGAHRVMSMSPDADSDALDVESGSHIVTALVEECASPRGPITASSLGWTAVTDPASDQPITSPVELQPTTDGTPSIDGSRRIDADTCAMGDLVFVISDGSDVVGFHFEQAGSRTATWVLTSG